MTAELRRDLERARAIAVSLEQECARLQALLDERDQPAPDGDVVGQEGLPLGDPWGESPIPDDWREEE